MYIYMYIYIYIYIYTYTYTYVERGEVGEILKNALSFSVMELRKFFKLISILTVIVVMITCYGNHFFMNTI